MKPRDAELLTPLRCVRGSVSILGNWCNCALDSQGGTLMLINVSRASLLHNDADCGAAVPQKALMPTHFRATE